MRQGGMCVFSSAVFRVANQKYDSDLGLYYLRARYYNPTTDRFMSRDPEDPQLLRSNGYPTDPRDFEKYIYANADPVNLGDPWPL